MRHHSMPFSSCACPVVAVSRCQLVFRRPLFPSCLTSSPQSLAGEGAVWRGWQPRIWFAAVLLFLAMAAVPDIAQAQRPLGIDVSSFQGSGVDWTSVKNSGRVFAWAKATEGVSINDADFTVNENNGKTAGMYMGAYHFAHPELNTPAAEASHFWSIAGTYILADGKTFMPMLDIEGSAFSGNVGASSISDWINQWCTDIVQDAANAGVSVKPVIYVSACNACSFDGTVAQWFNDIANYGGTDGDNDPTNGTPWSSCTSCEVWGSGVWNVWQYASAPPDGSVPGVSGNCDVDVFNGTLAGLQSTMLATPSASSAIFYWDPQGTTGANPYLGSMSGTWENSKWSYTSAGLAGPTNWVEGKATCFGVHTGVGTPAYTVTMNSSHVVAGFFDGGLSPKACDVTITGSGIIDLASGPQALDAQNGSDGSSAFLRIDCVIDGNGQLYPEGNGQSFLNATNTFTGGTTLGYPGVPFSGTVNFNNGSAFGTGPIVLTNTGTGGALVLEGSSAVTVTNPVSVTIATTNNIVGNAAGLTFSGTWSMGGHLFTFGTGNNAVNQTILSGVVSGTAGLTVFNSGTLVLSGTNTYSGTTAINSPAVLTIGGAGQLGSGAYAGNIVNNGTFNYNSTASQTISGIISGTGPLKQNNAGSLTLSGVNTYSGGTIVSSGATLMITADSGLGSASAGLTLNGGCLKNNNSAPTLGSGRTITLGANGGYFDAGWAPANPVTINSKLTGSGSLLINLDGSPVVLANTANNYTGNTIIGTNGPGYFPTGAQAWLKLGASAVLPNGSGKGNLYIYQAYDGLLDLAGFSQTVNGLSGDGVVDNSTGSGSLSVGNNNQSSTFSGVIQNTAGTLALTKVGTGTFTLGGANTYVGNTLVSAGTLALGNGGSIGASSVGVASTAILANVTTNAATIGGATIFASGAFGSFTAVGGIPSTIGKISVTGNLTLNGNAFTINVSGPALAVGTYRLLDCTGTLSGSANATPTITGTPIAAGYAASIGTATGSTGHVDLVVQAIPLFSNLTNSQSVIYGTPAVALGGTLSGPGPLYPMSGETVLVTINSNAQPATISDTTGDFSINYNLSGIPAGSYPINYSYAGDPFLTPAANSGTSLTNNPLPVILTGTRPYDGTNDAAAAILSVMNTVGTDVVTVASGTATLAGSDVGVEPIESFGTLALGGPAVNNYTLTGASGSVTITAAGFLITGEYIDGTGTNLVITWQSTPGTTYQVLGSTNVAAAVNTWPTVGDPILATNISTSATIPVTSDMSVFEVKSQ
jgi:autotransporter-associated beta strand protein